MRLTVSSARFRQICIIRRISENILILLLQYMGLTMGQFTTPPLPVWFATGITCGFIFLRGNRILPGIALGTFLAYYLVGFSTSTALACAILYSLQSLLTLLFHYRFINCTLIFYSVETYLRFLIWTACLTLSFTFLLIYYCQAERALIDVWWLGNMNSYLIFGCALIALDTYFPQIHQLKKVSLLTLVFLYGSFLSLHLLMITISSEWILILFGAYFILLIIISLHYGWCGSCAALALSILLLNIATYLQSPFITSMTLTHYIDLQLAILFSTVFSQITAIQVEKHKLKVLLSNQ